MQSNRNTLATKIFAKMGRFTMRDISEHLQTKCVDHKSKNSTIRNIGIFGGTFDPIHNGHLQMALETIEQLRLDEVRFIPCKNPVHKNTVFADESHRVNMLKYALQFEKKFILDTREITRAEPSYTIYTLNSLKAEFPQANLYLMLGLDAFATLPNWYQADAILLSCKLICFNRILSTSIGLTTAHFQLKEILERPFYHALKVTQNPLLFEQVEGPALFPMQTRLIEISSTDVRHRIQAKQNIHYLVPEAVAGYIQKQGLYTQHT